MHLLGHGTASLDKRLAVQYSTYMICRTCKQDKPEDAFHFRNRLRGTRKKQCAECFNSWRKKWYLKNKEYYINNSIEHKRQQRLENKRKVKEILSIKGCLRCPEVHPACLDFHHIGRKREGISKMVQRGDSWKKIRREIDKCIVLCANCHRKEHYMGS